MNFPKKTRFTGKLNNLSHFETLTAYMGILAFFGKQGKCIKQHIDKNNYIYTAIYLSNSYKITFY